MQDQIARNRNFYNDPLQLDGLRLEDVMVCSQSGHFRMCLGMTINLYCRGHRDTYGPLYKRILEDTHSRVGQFFQSRNANGKLRKITPKAIIKEHAEFDPLAPSEKRRSPLVYISRYCNREGIEIPPILGVLYGDYDQKFSLALSLPILSDELPNQLAHLTAAVRAWLPGLPLVCGTITPTMVHSLGGRPWVADEMEALSRRYPVLLSAFDDSCHLDGLVNWGMVTLLGPELQARLGGLAAMQRDLPAGFSLESCEGQALVLAKQENQDVPATIPESYAQAYRALSAYFSPIKSSTWGLRKTGEEDWHRFK